MRGLLGGAESCFGYPTFGGGGVVGCNGFGLRGGGGGSDDRVGLYARCSLGNSVFSCFFIFSFPSRYYFFPSMQFSGGAEAERHSIIGRRRPNSSLNIIPTPFHPTVLEVCDAIQLFTHTRTGHPHVELRRGRDQTSTLPALDELRLGAARPGMV